MINKVSSRLNVLICAYGVDSEDVGEAQMAYKWVYHLSSRVNVCLLTMGSRLNDATGLEACHSVKIVRVEPKINFKRWDAFDRMFRPNYIEFFIKSAKIVEKVIKENSIDVCHHLSPFSFRYPSPLSLADIPLIVGPIYGGLKAPAIMRELGAKESWLAKLRNVDSFRMHFDPFLKRHYGRASKLLISAPYVKPGLLLRDQHKSEVISGIAIDEDSVAKFVRHKSHKFLRIISVSRIVASKGLELLILALAKCKYKEKIRLDIYGCGPLERDYSELAARIGVSNRLTWKGFTPNEKVLKAYADADIFVLPSLKEPAGIAVIEAMAAGLPVVCVDAGGPGYTVDQNCGIKIPLTNKKQMVNDLAQAIDTLVSDPDKRQAMGHNAQLRVKQEFIWDAVVEKMLKVYEEVISENNR